MVCLVRKKRYKSPFGKYIFIYDDRSVSKWQTARGECDSRAENFEYTIKPKVSAAVESEWLEVLG